MRCEDGFGLGFGLYKSYDYVMWFMSDDPFYETVVR